MGLLAFGILLVIIGLALGVTNFLGLGLLADEFWWIGWLIFGIGLILAIVHMAMGPRRTVVYERRV